jgi:hypothetical protein
LAAKAFDAVASSALVVSFAILTPAVENTTGEPQSNKAAALKPTIILIQVRRPRKTHRQRRDGDRHDTRLPVPQDYPGRFPTPGIS